MDLTREFINAFDKIGIETSKEEKKRKKKEIVDRQQFELARFKEVFMIQVNLLNNLLDVLSLIFFFLKS